jgi:hypothetical protein
MAAQSNYSRWIIGSDGERVSSDSSMFSDCRLGVMTGQALKKLEVEGVTEFWFRPDESAPEPPSSTYRPAAFIECSVNFRSLRAGLNHSEERNYTAWLPERDLAIDWDSPAISFDGAYSLTTHQEPGIPYRVADYSAKCSDLEQYEAELIDKLLRNERLKVYFNPVFGLFSAPGDDLKDFLARVAEAALSRVEPELKRLRNRFELHLEQVRETYFDRDELAEELSFDRFISRKIRLFESENRMAAMFSTLAGSVFGTTEPRAVSEASQPGEIEMRADLDRVEQEASEALQALYSEYLAVANEYDIYEIGLQPDNIQVIRRSVLWVPVADQ